MSQALHTDDQLDALREVANVGVGHAANALGRLMGGRVVNLSLPRALVCSAGDVVTLVGGPAAPVSAVHLGMTGGLDGLVLVVLPEADGAVLAHALTGPGAAESLRDSALNEVANIVASACLSAIGTMTGLKLLPGIPLLEHGPARDVVQAALEAAHSPGGWVVLEARFAAVGAPPVSGQLLLVLERSRADALLRKLGL